MSKISKFPYGIHWFRRDLRCEENRALLSNLRRHEGRVLGLFAFDPSFLSRPDFSYNRFGFFIETLLALKTDMQRLGGDLLVLDEGPDAAFDRLFCELQRLGVSLPQACSFNKDYEPFARERDARVTLLLEKTWGVSVIAARDHLILEPGEVIKDNAKDPFYRVFTPFRKRWLDVFHSPTVQQRFNEKFEKPEFRITWSDLFGNKSEIRDHLLEFRKTNSKKTTVSLPDSGVACAAKKLKEFKNRISRYAVDRDFPAINGTSQLSIFLKNGSLTTEQVVRNLKLSTIREFKKEDGEATFLSELIWREFYYHILYHFPFVEKTAFQEKYRNLRWENREDFFETWKEGRTGFGIVDAGMRQLNKTGWMHNRVRMIVASFLTKDLHIDWRWGERYFMEKLIDGDLAPNNGGWQWAASTGCDAQPYFRVFNPDLQEKRFDPNGEYVRKYVLRPSSTRIVNHSIRARKAIQLYQSVNTLRA